EASSTTANGAPGFIVCCAPRETTGPSSCWARRGTPAASGSPPSWPWPNWTRTAGCAATWWGARRRSHSANSARRPSQSAVPESKGWVRRMDFALDEKTVAMRERLLAFMEKFVYPAEGTFRDQAARAHEGSAASRWDTPPVIEELKAEARAEGL